MIGEELGGGVGGFLAFDDQHPVVRAFSEPVQPIERPRLREPLPAPLEATIWRSTADVRPKLLFPSCVVEPPYIPEQPAILVVVVPDTGRPPYRMLEGRPRRIRRNRKNWPAVVRIWLRNWRPVFICRPLGPLAARPQVARPQRGEDGGLGTACETIEKDAPIVRVLQAERRIGVVVGRTHGPPAVCGALAAERPRESLGWRHDRAPYRRAIAGSCRRRW